MRHSLLIAAYCLATAAAVAAQPGPDIPDGEASSDIQVGVLLDAAEQSGSANATVRIRASRQTVWALITSCPEA